MRRPLVSLSCWPSSAQCCSSAAAAPARDAALALASLSLAPASSCCFAPSPVAAPAASLGKIDSSRTPSLPNGKGRESREDGEGGNTGTDGSGEEGRRGQEKEEARGQEEGR
jgi:hypothetical protein